MTVTSQQHADLSSDAYTDRTPGIRKPGEEEKITINGTTYKILEHVNNPRNGYQGTIYQRVDTGDIVVGHRGTEQMFLDGAVADGGMVTRRTNLQAPDAIALTERALERAREIGRFEGKTPEVTVTGHSLGGCLAQITAHHFGLRGETFNAYGAVSLGLRIPEGGTDVTNHVLAGDVVSAAGGHYGRVVVHAAPSEIEVLRKAGYANDDSFFDRRAIDVALVRMLPSHSMHHFTNESGDKPPRPDVSILSDPQARPRAEQYSAMIEKFRNDVGTAREAVTLLSGTGLDAIQRVTDRARGPLAPGEPHAREQAERGNGPREAGTQPLPWQDEQGRAIPLSERGRHQAPAVPFRPDADVPAAASHGGSAQEQALQQMRDALPKSKPAPTEQEVEATMRDFYRSIPRIDAPGHPDGPMFRTLLKAVHEEDERRGRAPDEVSTRVAAGLTADAAERDLKHIGFAQFIDNGRKVAMSDTEDPSKEWARTATGDVARAAQTPVEDNSQRLADIRIAQAQTLEQTQALERTRGPDEQQPRGPTV